MADNKLKELAETPATWYKEGALVSITLDLLQHARR